VTRPGAVLGLVAALVLCLPAKAADPRTRGPDSIGADVEVMTYAQLGLKSRCNLGRPTALLTALRMIFTLCPAGPPAGLFFVPRR
jgi:hypothetical protein